MNIMAGKILLKNLLDRLDAFIIDSYDNTNLNLLNLSIIERVGRGFNKELLKKPIIIYIKKGKLPYNAQIDDIQKYLNFCVGVERIRELLYFGCLSKNILESFEVECILIESDYNDIQRVDVISDLVNLDFMIKRKENGKISQSGAINYSFIDTKFFYYYEDYKTLNILNKNRKYYSQNILGLNLTENKQRNKGKIKYIEAEFKFYKEPDEIDLEKYDIKNRLFVMECPVCGSLYEIKLYGYKKTDEINVADYIFYDNEQNRFYFKCNHIDTKCENHYKEFSILNKFNYPQQLTTEQYNKLFIYFFVSFKRDRNSITYFDKDGKESSINNDGFKIKKDTNAE